MKCSSRTRVRDPNQYRQTDTQLLGSIHLRFVHRFTFFPPADLSLYFGSAKCLKRVALSETERKETPVVPLFLLQGPKALHLNRRRAFLLMMKPNERPY